MIGQSLHVQEHRIGYSDSAFAGNKSLYVFSFKLPKHPEGVKIWSRDINPKLFMIKFSQSKAIWIRPLWLTKANI